VVLLTGATGFVGRRVAAALQASGVSVRAVVRSTSDTSGLADVDVVRCGLTAGPALADAAEGVTEVIHCAGGGWVRRPGDLRRNNLDPTLALLEVCRHIQRFVFVSTMAADAPRSDYGRAKAAAEDAVRGSGIPFVIVRPPAIYGPGDTRLLPLFRSAQRGLVALPAIGRALSLVHVDDCVRAILASRSAPPGGCYGVTDGPAHRHTDLVTVIGEAVGRRPRIIRVPRGVIWMAAVLSEIAGRLRDRPVLLTRDKVRDLWRADAVCDATALRADTGWRPQIGLAEGIAETAADYQERGWL